MVILGENISQEDLNLKFLRSLPSEWNTHVVVWRNKPDLNTMSFDYLYNNLKIVKQEVKGTASSSSSSQNMDFVSSPSSTNEVNTAYGVGTANTQVSPASTQVSPASTQVSTTNLSDASVYAFLASQPNGSQLVYEDLEQIHEDDLEEMDLKWQLALLSMKTRRFFQKSGRKITINGSDTAGYDKSKVKCFNCHKMGHFTRECKGPRNQDSRNMNQDRSRRTVNVEETSSKAMVAIDGVGFDWSYMADDGVGFDWSYMADDEVLTNMALMAFSDSKVHNDKTCSKACLKSFETLITQLDDLKIEFNKSEFNLGLFSPPNPDLSYSSLEEFQQPEFEGYGPKPSKSVSEDISNEVRKSPDAQLADCDYHQRERVIFENNYTRVNYNYFDKQAHPSAHRNIVSRAVLRKIGLRPLNTARPVNTAHPKSTVYSARPKPKAVNTTRLNSAVVNAGHPQKEDQGYVDSGCLRHRIGNMSYLLDFREFNGGYVTFGGGAKGGKITSKGTLKTDKPDFEDVYFVKELQFNLFSVS
ncbi:ribonuclease H-like domain-containing protein [Tanacetum coccineum]